jgi:methylmalonyl-CoA/ethylmalonyl-CoA epimerase
MGLKRIDHIGVAVEDAAAVARIFCDLLGTARVSEEELAVEGVKVVSVTAGDDHIEFFEPTRADHSVRRFLDKRGNALHHISIEVDDLTGELSRLAACGVELIDRAPRPGAGGKRVAFIHPRATGGILIELSDTGTERSPEQAP